MRTDRLEAFSDGVLAIVLTIMVMGLPRPAGDAFSDLIHTTGLGLVTYLVSFVYVGIYWNNHHHTLQLADQVDGSVLWANLIWLFSISLLPFTTEWVDSTKLAWAPVVLYGVDLLFTAVTFFCLQHRIIKAQGKNSILKEAIGNDWKGKASSALYLAGIVAAVIDQSAPIVGNANVGSIAAVVIYIVVAAIWVVPDRRIDRVYRQHVETEGHDSRE